MNKCYQIKKITSAWLAEVKSDNIIIGIKNIIGIVVEYNNENLFYSILDDCFFKIDFFNEKLADNKGKYLNKIFDEVMIVYDPYMERFI